MIVKRFSFVLVLVAVSIAVLNAVAVVIGGDGWTKHIVDLSAVAVALIAVIACWLVVPHCVLLRLRNHAWVPISVGFTLFLFGELAWAFQELVQDISVPIGGIADFFWTVAYVWWIVGIFLYIRSHDVDRRLLWSSLAVNVVLALALVLTQLRSVCAGSADWVTFIEAMYPVYDLVMLAIVLAVVVSMRGQCTRERLPFVMMCIAIVIWAVYDCLFAGLTSMGAYESGHLIDVLYAFGYVFVTIAAALEAKVLSKYRLHRS
jgi:hypothetical protein